MTRAAGRRLTKRMDAGARSPRGMTRRAAALGLAGGMRSMAPGAMLALSHDDASATAGWLRGPVLRTTWGRRLLVLMGVGELIGDKLPTTPSRLELPALIGRVAIAAIGAGAIGSEYGGGKGRIAWAVIVGAAAALAGNVLFANARAAAVARTKLPDPVVAVAEDATCIALLTAVARTRPAR